MVSRMRLTHVQRNLRFRRGQTHSDARKAIYTRLTVSASECGTPRQNLTTPSSPLPSPHNTSGSE